MSRLSITLNRDDVAEAKKTAKALIHSKKKQLKLDFVPY